MSFFDDLLDGVLGTGKRAVKGTANNVLDSLLGSLGITNNGVPYSQSGMATETLEDLYRKATQGVGLKDYANTQLTPEKVNYGTVANPGTITPDTYTPGTLNYRDIPGFEQLVMNGYDPALAQNVDPYTAAQMQAQQIQDTATYNAATGQAAQIDPAVQYQASQIDPSQMTAAQIEELATTNPELYQAVLLGDAQKAQANEELRGKQMGQLDQFEDLARAGFDQADQLANNQILNDQARQSTRQQQAITDNLRQRGVSSGALEGLMRQNADQQASETGQAAGLGLLNEQRNRKQQNLTNASNLTNALQNQDINLSTTNAAAQNQFSMANQGAQNQAGQFNANATNQSNQFNAQSENQKNLQNANLQQQANQQNANLEQQAGLANQNAQNEAAQFGANAQNQVNTNNANLNQQQNLANQNALNQANQFNTGALNETQQQNANLAQQANQFNAGAQNQANQFNLGQQQQVNLANQGAQNQANQFGANANNQAAQFNASQENDRLTNNTNLANANALAQFNANNSAQQFNIGNSMNAQQQNIANQLGVNQFNQSQLNNMSRDNANIVNNINNQNRDYAYNVVGQQNQNAMQQFQNMLNAGKSLADQQNAIEAAAAIRQYGANMGGGNSGSNTMNSLLNSLGLGNSTTGSAGNPIDLLAGLGYDTGSNNSGYTGLLDDEWWDSLGIGDDGSYIPDLDWNTQNDWMLGDDDDWIY